MAPLAQTLVLTMLLAGGPPPDRPASIFCPASLRQRAAANAAKYPWAKAIQKRTVDRAEPWRKMSDEDLWALMFGPTITRSWMVWSNGECPACRKPVPMYEWLVAPREHPWKAGCPHCREWFPKNDFVAFYRSGLGKDGVFDPHRANRSLLFNADHPAADDPLRPFGVDDGEGYAEGNKRWRFIGTYLIHGQWKTLVVCGVLDLSAAYALTGDPVYAHKAAVLLDRVADLYPTFDYSQQGLAYERRQADGFGYVSVWHDACVETRNLALAYDQIRDGLADDAPLVAFLAAKGLQCGLDNPKATVADIRRNIEDRLLRDPLLDKNRRKTASNYPQTDITRAVLRSVLDPAGSREEVRAAIDAMVEKATAVDGLTGEKGLAGYAPGGPRGLAEFLSLYLRTEPSLLADLLRRHPSLRQTYRFHLDTWFEQSYYPNSGDAASFAAQIRSYAGLDLARPGEEEATWSQPPLRPSMYTFLWRLYELTGDADYARLMYRANGSRVDGLPHDIFAEDPESVQRTVAEVIRREGAEIAAPSVNKRQWHLAILRSGRGDHARAAWLDYDTGGQHGHADGMNLGLFAKGLDLMPDFGYPPVNYGGWNSPRARWYTMSAAHNTVVVDGKDHDASKGQGGTLGGKTTLWADGRSFHAIRASCPEMIGGARFERTAALVDINGRESYLVDLFRVAGGGEHAKFMHSQFGAITTAGLTLSPTEDYGHGTQMRDFRRDEHPRPGWSVDWRIDDRRKYLPAGADVHLRYTDLTEGAEAQTCQGWIQTSVAGATDGAWIPRVMVRRRGQAPLASTFVAVIEPYERQSNIAGISRLRLQTPAGEAADDADVAIEVRLTGGWRDLLVSAGTSVGAASTRPADPAPGERFLETPKPTDSPRDGDWHLRFDGDLCLVRAAPSGTIQDVVLCRARQLAVGGLVIRTPTAPEFLELKITATGVEVVSGRRQDIEDVHLKGQSIFKR